MAHEINAYVEKWNGKRWNKGFRLNELAFSIETRKLFLPWDYDVPDEWLDVIKAGLPRDKSQWLNRISMSYKYKTMFHVELTRIVDNYILDSVTSDMNFYTNIFLPIKKFMDKEKVVLHHLRLVGMSNI